MLDINNYNLDDFLIAAKHFVKIVSDGKYKYYEMVEDTYEYDNGLMLIIYADKEHKKEIKHYILDMDDKKGLLELKESLKNWKIIQDESEERTIYLVDVGHLIDKDDEGGYYKVYDKKYGYFDEDQYYTSNLWEALLFGREYVANNDKNYCVIIKQSDKLAEMISDEDIANGDVGLHSETSWNVKDIVYCIKNDNDVLVEDFIDKNSPSNNSNH